MSSVAERNGACGSALAEVRRASGGVEASPELGVQEAFLNRLAHELRSPLNTILSLSDAFAEGLLDELPPEAARLVGLMGQAARQQAAMLERLLEFSRLRAGRLVPQVSATSIRGFAELIQVRFSPLAVHRRVGWGVAVEGGERCLETDVPRLLIAIGCLVENSLKYTPAGRRAEFEVSVSEGRVVFRISDEGPGLPESAVLAATGGGDVPEFRPEGLGLGLPLALGIVACLGGRWEVSARCGTCFIIDLPLQAGDRAAVNWPST